MSSSSQTICPVAAKLKACSQGGCARNHFLVDSAFLEHVVHSSRAREPQTGSSITIEYSAGLSSPWTVRCPRALPNGRVIQTHAHGTTLLYALNALLANASPSHNPVKTWNVHPKTLCDASLTGTCPTGPRCSQSHTLFDSRKIEDFVVRHGYPGHPFSMAYTDSADPLLGRKWRLAMAVEDLGGEPGSLQPWREVSVVHSDVHTALRVLASSIVSGMGLPPDYESEHPATDRISDVHQQAEDQELPPAYEDRSASRRPVRIAGRVRPIAPLPTRARLPDSNPISAPFTFLGSSRDGATRAYGIDLFAPASSPAQNMTFGPGRRRDADPGRSSGTPSLFTRELYDARPGEFPWTTWENTYWLIRSKPPRSRHRRLNAEYSLGLPPAPPIANPDLLDMIDELDNPEASSVRARAIRHTALSCMEHLVRWRIRVPAGYNRDRAVFEAIQNLDRAMPYHHLYANATPANMSVLLMIFHLAVVPPLLWVLDTWLFGRMIWWTIRTAAWAFYCYVYPPVIPCILTAWLTQSRFLMFALLLVLSPSEIYFTVLNFITFGWCFKARVFVVYVKAGAFLYFAILRCFGYPMYLLAIFTSRPQSLS
ncbi:hypothetical protein PsYK624_057240 [Phanerochaete sordida]|uniref:C3H1-type domain-containing protein n=1 Tax=Phanerochaete sordida TaxID=48140 RepID=A0A9P3LBW2_9APHY|nr:hypothetical protein PsYK624_057240 [Phanerochaete sordida]